MTDFDARLPDPANDRDEPTDDEIVGAAEEFCTWDFTNDICEMCSLESDKDLLAWAKTMRAKFDDYLADVVANREQQNSDGDE